MTAALRRLARLLGLAAGIMPAVACATPIERHRVGAVRFIYADASAVNAHCSKRLKFYDDGTPADGSRKVRCCAVRRAWPRSSTVFVSWGAEDCVTHELCHLNGYPAAECDKIHIGKGSSSLPRNP